MLLSFRFANHRSFRDEQQLNLMPIHDDEQGSGEPALPVRVVGIFGANASGKSNCLDALGFMRRLVVFSDREVEPGLGPAREPFRLTAEARQAPSRYVVDLRLDGIRYTYGFALDDERILEEWLYQYQGDERQRLFEREGDDCAFPHSDGSEGRKGLEQIADITARTALFSSTVARFHRNYKRVQPLHQLYRWFSQMQTPDFPGFRPSGVLTSYWPDDEAGRATLVSLLRAANVGIIDVEISAEEAEHGYGEHIQTNTRRWLGHHTPQERKRLRFAHRGAEGEVLFDLTEESTGTQQLLRLAIEASSVLGRGGTMCVDEIDASLHPLLTAKLVGLFRSPVSNPRHSQLIFTSHDAALLGTIDAEEILHRDEIWFTEKDEAGASSLYPLTDFKLRREDENRQRRYLNGNYGAIPDLSTYLFEQALATRGAVNDTEAQ